jgi:hypothetical protein
MTRTTLTPIQRAVRSAERAFGKALTDIAVQVAQARAAGDEGKATGLLAGVRERRRRNMDRLADSLRAISGGAKPDRKVAHWTAKTPTRAAVEVQ